MNFNRIRKNYNSGLWSKIMVKNAVKAGFITTGEYRAITGEEYVENV